MALDAPSVTRAVPARNADGPVDAARLQTLLLELVSLINQLAQQGGGGTVTLGVALTALKALTPAADKFPYFSGTTTAALADLSPAARELLAKVDLPAIKSYVGVLPVGTAAGTVAAGDDPRFGAGGGGTITIIGGIPRHFSPEDFGAPKETGGVVPPPTSADDAGLAECFRRASATGSHILFQRLYGSTSTKVLTFDRESLKDGMRIVGVGDFSSGIQMLGNNYNAIELRGTTISGKARPFHPYLGHFGIYGGELSGKGIFVRFSDTDVDDRISHAKIEKIRMRVGSDGIHAADAFNIHLDTMKISSAKGHCFNLEGGNATTLTNCYAAEVGIGKAGYRIVYMATLQGCTGLDDATNVSFWGIFGGRAYVGGTSRGSASSTRLRLDAADAASVHELPGLWIQLQSGANAGFKTLILQSGSNATDGKYVDVLTAFPGGSVPSGVTYRYFDNESSGRNKAGTGMTTADPINRRFQGGILGCNVELWGRDGIKFLQPAQAVIERTLFYNYEGVNYDSCIHFWGNNPDSLGSRVAYCKFDTSGATRRQPQDILQARGGGPCFVGEGLPNTHWTYRDMSAPAAAKRFRHLGPRSEQYPDGFPTTDPGGGMAWIGA